jgi:hypothetical protein
MCNAHPKFLLCTILVLALVFLVACSSEVAPTPTPTIPPVTNTPLPTPTNTERPTTTPRPTLTPDVVATEIYDNLFSQVQMFKDEGLIPSTNGEYIELETFSKNIAKIGWLQYWYYGFEVENFVFNANAKWRTAVDTSDTSGCGIVFALQEKENSNEYYGIVLDKSRIYFTFTRSGYYHELGKTRGTGRLDFGNPAEAEMTVLVYDEQAYVYVDDDFIGEYTLSEDKELRGKFGFGLISGTNKDYGTNCHITNARIWALEP